MVNWKLIAKIMGFLLLIEAGLMVLCQVTSWIYGEGIRDFMPPIALAVLLAAILLFFGRKAGKKMGR